MSSVAGRALYVRTDGTVGKRLAPADLAVEGGSVRVSAETLVALSEDGPFEPLAQSILRDARLRDELARDIPIPSLRDHQRRRLALIAAAIVPLGMLLELDRELVIAQHASVGRAAIDLILTAFIGWELSRRTPRFPGICAIALVAVGLRWGLVAARLCGHDVHLLVYVAAALSVGSALVLLTRVPSRSRVALELLGKLGISRSELFSATQAREPPPALIAAAIGCAAGLPAILHLARMLGAGLVVQAAVFVGFAVIAPKLARTSEPAAPPRPSLSRIHLIVGIAAGLALAAAAISAGRLFFDAGAEIARCVERLDAEAKLARAAESAELGRALARVRSSGTLVMMTALLFPFAEERIYRGLLQEVLTRKFGHAYGLFAASLAFGIAHLGVYQVALYQTVLLGLGFGVAWAEGGLVAAFIVHATWNLIQLG